MIATAPRTARHILDTKKLNSNPNKMVDLYVHLSCSRLAILKRVSLWESAALRTPEFSSHVVLRCLSLHSFGPEASGLRFACRRHDDKLHLDITRMHQFHQ